MFDNSLRPASRAEKLRYRALPLAVVLSLGAGAAGGTIAMRIHDLRGQVVCNTAGTRRGDDVVDVVTRALPAGYDRRDFNDFGYDAQDAGADHFRQTGDPSIHEGDMFKDCVDGTGNMTAEFVPRQPGTATPSGSAG